jgi:hypothetical protein
MLIAAILRDDTRGVVALLRQGADPNCHAEAEWRASPWQVLCAAMLGKRSAPVRTPTALLLATKPHVEFDDLLDAPDLPQNCPDNLELVRALLDHGADPNAADPKGFTSLLYAIRWQERVTAGILLAHGADPDRGDRNRVTPLMVAVYLSDTPAIRMLLDRGAHVDRQDDISGQTALMLAAILKRPSCIAALMAGHPDLNLRDHAGKSALDYANASGDRGMLAVLKRARALRDRPVRSAGGFRHHR